MGDDSASAAAAVLKGDLEGWIGQVFGDRWTDISVEMCGSTSKGDGYLGDVTFARVGGTARDGHRHTCAVAVKTGKRSPALRAAIPIKGAFENEIAMYRVVLPLLAAFQGRRADAFDNYPKFFGGLVLDGMEVLVLEDVRAAGFALWDRMAPMDAPHLAAVLGAYARFHAASLAARRHQPDVFRRMRAAVGDVWDEFIETTTQFDFEPFADVIRGLEEAGDGEVAARVAALQSDVGSLKGIADAGDEYSVVLHGDCWNNNFMFRDEGGDAGLRVCLLDWQLSRVGSPVLDLSYFLFNCMSPAHFGRFDELTELYYAALDGQLRRFGSSAAELYPRAVYQQHWTAYSRFGFHTTPTILRLALSTKDEAPDLSDAFDGNDEPNFQNAFAQDIGNMREYKQRACGIAKFVYQRGFI